MFHFAYLHQYFWILILILMFFIVTLFSPIIYRWTVLLILSETYHYLEFKHWNVFVFFYFAADQPKYNGHQIWHRWTLAKKQKWTRLAAWNRSATRHWWRTCFSIDKVYRLAILFSFTKVNPSVFSSPSFISPPSPPSPVILGEEYWVCHFVNAAQLPIQIL